MGFPASYADPYDLFRSFRKSFEKHRCMADTVQAVLFPNGTHVPASKLIVPGQAPETGYRLKAKSIGNFETEAFHGATLPHARCSKTSLVSFRCLLQA